MRQFVLTAPLPWIELKRLKVFHSARGPPVWAGRVQASCGGGIAPENCKAASDRRWRDAPPYRTGCRPQRASNKKAAWRLAVSQEPEHPSHDKSAPPDGCR